MRSDNNSRLLWTSLILAGLILVAFQLYLNREPARIQAVQAADRQQLISAGQALYGQNCASCHGAEGEGADAPALNSKQFLTAAHDETMFGLIANGIPGTEMPAWSQAHGGPFTDEEIRQMVAFIRSWEPAAPDLGQQRMRVDAQRGAQIFAGTCAICHGPNGQGGTAPALNDPVKLQQFDDPWYAETIARGRPAQGMPVWGTVLSPQQIADVVALIGAWRRGEQIVVGDVAGLLEDALHALEHNEIGEATELLEQAADVTEHEQAEVIEQALAALDAGNIKEATALIEQTQGLMGEMMGEMATPEAEHGEEAPASTSEHSEETPAAEHHEEMPAIEATLEAAGDPGVQQLQAAVQALEQDKLDEAKKALTEALERLPSGDLFEAAEHALEDIEAGKPGEALEMLAKALADMGQP